MFRRILIATDFSTCAEAARSLATDLAQIHRAELTLLHVQAPLPAYAYAEVASPDLVERIHAEHSRWAQARLEEYVNQASAAGLRATASLRTGAAPEEIAEAAQEHGADLARTDGRDSTACWSAA